jgi:hypothetical protein
MMLFFELTDAQIEPADMPSNKPLFDPATVTGEDIVKGNAAKESGYSDAQLEKLQEQLQGKMLTFENGKVMSVSKSDDYVTVNVTFADPTAKGLFASTFTVSAKVTDSAAMKIAEQFDEGLKIKTVKGKVAKKGFMMLFFELTDAQIEPAK